MKEKPGVSLRTCADVVQELLTQPALFLEFDGVQGLEPKTLPQSLQRYTGARSTQDEERMLKVGALRLLGASDRDIEQACHVTRRTIPILLAELERSGRITPLKQRLAAMTGDNAERANIALRVLLDKAAEGPQGEDDLALAQMIKAVATASGIATEKYLLLTGQATEIVEQRTGAGREEFETWWRESVKPAQVVAVDSGSGANPTKQAGNGESSPPGHVADTSGPGPDQGAGGVSGAGAAGEGDSST